MPPTERRGAPSGEGEGPATPVAPTAPTAPVVPSPVLLRPRWIAGHLLALVLVVAFVNFGFWQLRRLQAVRARNATIVERTALAPLALDDALAGVTPEAFPEYRSVQADGVFDPAHEVLLRGRSLGGQPGFHVVTPLVLPSGDAAAPARAVLVERGWVPYELDAVPVEGALPPEGSVTVVGELRAAQTPPTGAWAALAPRDPTDGPLTQTFYVDLERLQPQMPYALAPAWITLRAMTPPSAGDLPKPLPEHDLDEGPHLGYAIQWFAFAVVGVVGYALLLRATVRRETTAG